MKFAHNVYPCPISFGHDSHRQVKRLRQLRVWSGQGQRLPHDNGGVAHAVLAMPMRALLQQGRYDQCLTESPVFFHNNRPATRNSDRITIVFL